MSMLDCDSNTIHPQPVISWITGWGCILRRGLILFELGYASGPRDGIPQRQGCSKRDGKRRLLVSPYFRYWEKKAASLSKGIRFTLSYRSTWPAPGIALAINRTVK